jgi:hypothetical protein
MKSTETLLILAIALSLGGCGTLGGLTGDQKLAVLKGASEHLQSCTRIYNVNSGFPPSTSVAITCMPGAIDPAMQRAPADPALLRQIIREEVVAALKAP